MSEPLALDVSRGTRLDIDVYRSEFRRHRGAIHGRDSWKFERRQHFDEGAYSPGREAFGRGDWAAAMRFLEEKREAVLRSLREDQEQQSVFHRVRIVEDPISAYLQWELRSLRMQAECGVPVRVVSAEAVRAWETERLLPEVVVLGEEALYEVVYSDDGVPVGAVRFTDDVLVKTWVDPEPPVTWCRPAALLVESISTQEAVSPATGRMT